MAVVSAERFASGLTWADFFAACEKHQDLREHGYRSVVLTPEQQQRLQAWRDNGIRVLVLEEDWCSDAARSGPILARLAELAGIEARWFLRDQNLDLMDQYLENGKSRAIPVFVFMDSNNEYVAHWGSRPAAVRAAAQPFLPLPPEGDPRRPEVFEQFRQALAAAYAENYPGAIIDELLTCVEAGLQARK